MKRMALALAIVGSVVASSWTLAGPVNDFASTYRQFIGGEETQEYQELLRGGEWAEITIWGDGATNLDLFIYDELGNLVAYDTDASDWATVTLLVPETQTYTIRVVNLDACDNLFDITIE